MNRVLAVDTNILVYAHRREAAEHDAAMAALRSLAEGQVGRAIPWPCVYEFFSVVTNPRIWKGSQSSSSQAWTQLRAWFDAPSLQLVGETEGSSRLWSRWSSAHACTDRSCTMLESPPFASRTASKPC